jgi:phosphoglycerate dehydrogenase-like enzyme
LEDNINTNWIKSLSESYITEVLKRKKPKVLIVTLNNFWNMTSEDLNPLKQIADVEWIQTKNIPQEKLAEKCRGYQHLMLNVDALESDPSKMEKLDEKFYNHDGIKDLITFNHDMTDCDYFNPHMGIKKGLIIQDCPDATSESVAESTICEILLHTRHRHLAYIDQLKKQDVECRIGINLKGKTAGIVGYGNIGSKVADILRGFGMNILAYDIKNVQHKITPIEKLFEKSDIISVHIPTLLRSGKSNKNFINSNLLNRCKGSVLINLATDVIVDPSAAAAALKSKKLIGYSTQSNYSGEFAKKYISKFKGIDEFHLSPCSFNSKESRENIKRIWINNTVSTIQGNPQNVWNA